VAVNNSYVSQQVTYGTSSYVVNLITMTQLGNPDLKPERGTEWEGGFDVSFLENERLHFEVTMSRKFTRDAIVLVQQALSYGVDNTDQFINLGNVEDRSLELMGRFRVLDAPGYNWELTINRTQNRNKLVHLAAGALLNGPTGRNNFAEGYPLYGLWGVPVISYDDRNSDGILAENEITFGPLQYMGAPYPSAEIIYANDVSFLRRSVHVSATFDQVNGLANQYSIEDNSVYTRAAVDRTSSLAAQAGWLQADANNHKYIGQTTSVRLNELSVTYDVPPSLTQRLLHVQSLAVTFAGRNLAFWTTYAGKDPNVDTSGQLGDATSDNGGGLPQPRNFLLRFNVGF
jgi:hypothetical protein